MIKNNREFEVIFISPNDKYCYSWLYSKLQVLKRRTKLFNLLKTELSKQGYWRNQSRGNAQKGYKQGFGKNRDVY